MSILVTPDSKASLIVFSAEFLSSRKVGRLPIFKANGFRFDSVLDIASSKPFGILCSYSASATSFKSSELLKACVAFANMANINMLNIVTNRLEIRFTTVTIELSH